MDDDDDNDEREDENQDDDQDNPKRSYNKKKYFGNTTRDIRPLSMRAYYKPSAPFLKAFKITFEHGLKSLGGANMFNPLKIKLNHKQTYFDIVSKSKANLSLTTQKVQNYDINNNLTKKINNHSFSLSSKINNKNQANVKINHTIKWWENEWKLKYGVDIDRKRDLIYGGTFNIQKKNILLKKEGLSRFFSSYSDTIGMGFSLKSNLRKKFQSYYKSNLIILQSHRVYLEHKLGYDPSNASCYSNTFILNCQDSLGIGTFNGSVSFQNLALKSKEIRFVIEFQKSWVFGAQKRNDVFQFVLQKNRIGYSWLKNIKANVGNKGFFASADGKLKLFKTGIDYTINYKLKPLQQNFYEDSSLGFSLKWNL